MKVPSSVEENQVDKDILEMYSANVTTIQCFTEDDNWVRRSHALAVARRSVMHVCCLSGCSVLSAPAFLSLLAAPLPRFFTLDHVP